jgi:hypothetical protein
MRKFAIIATVAVAVVTWSGCASEEQTTRQTGQTEHRSAEKSTILSPPPETDESTVASPDAANITDYTVVNVDVCQDYATANYIVECLDVQTDATTKDDLATVAGRLRAARATDVLEIEFYGYDYTPTSYSSDQVHLTGMARTYMGEKTLRDFYTDWYGGELLIEEEQVAEIAAKDYILAWTKEELEAEGLITEETTPEESTVPIADTDLMAKHGSSPEYTDVYWYPCDFYELVTLCVTVSTEATDKDDLMAIAKDIRRRDTSNEVDTIFFYFPDAVPANGTQNDNLITGTAQAYKSSEVVRKAFPDATETELAAFANAGNIVVRTQEELEE